MRCFAVGVSIVLVVALAAPVSAQQPAATPLDSALRNQLDILHKAFNEGNAERASEVFLPEGEWTDESGDVHKGREAIALLFGAFFENFPGAKLELDIEGMRSLSSNLATAEVMRKVTVGGGGNQAFTRSTITFSKEGNDWLIASVLDDAAEDELTPHEHLLPLEWFVGEWVDEASDSIIEISAVWSEDKNYILVHYRVVREGKVDISSRQRIGWDPREGKIHSWLFDSDGGFGEGIWTRTGDQWVIKSEAVLPDGTTGSATFVFEPEGKDRFKMRALDRVVGDQLVEDTEVTIVRRPPQKK